MARYYKRAHFLLLGDENQSITDHSSTFEEVREVFSEHRGEVSECYLMTSYRSTPAITELFAKLAINNTGMQISSVQRDDKEPELIVCNNEEEFDANLKRVVTKLAEEKGLTPKGTAERIQKVLKTYGLPFECGLTLGTLTEAIALDKKNLNGNLNVILLHEIGDNYIEATDIQFFAETARLV